MGSKAGRSRMNKKRTITHYLKMRVRSTISSEWTCLANRWGSAGLCSPGVCPADAKDHRYRKPDLGFLRKDNRTDDNQPFEFGRREVLYESRMIQVTGTDRPRLGRDRR